MSKKDKGKKGAEKWDSEDVIQAVVIADSFNFRFLPVTIERPRALLPLVNRPLIDYTVEFLAVAGVQEIFVFCCTHADMIREHLRASRWMQPTSPVKLHIVVSEDCPSVGDALRDIDSQSLIRSDFVLVSGDLVANMELMEVVSAHKEARRKDKCRIMTCVYKKADPSHRTRSSEDDIFIATDSADDRLLHCEKPSGKRRVGLPAAILEEHPELELHYDVLDCHVSVCSPHVPQLFSDNFDYQTRHHFIRGILVNEEIMGNHIYAHFISDQYAAHVSNLHTYDAVSKDVVHRWVYPLVPDNVTGEMYSYGRHNIYLNANVTLALGCRLLEDVAIGRDTSIGANAVVSHSTIGHNCRIGDNVKIEGAYIWDDVVIESDSTVQQAIVCDRAVVKRNVTIEPGCILSYGVVVGPDFIVASGSRLTLKHPSETAIFSSDWDDEPSEEEKEEEEEEVGVERQPSKEGANIDEVGSEGRGFLWHPPAQDDDDDSERLVVENWPTREPPSLSDDGSSCSSRSSSPETALAMEAGDTDTLMFYNEILDSVRSGVAELVPNDNTILMINASKHAYNIPIGDVPPSIVKAILEGPLNSTTEQPTELLMYVKTAVGHLESLLQHYIKEEAVQLNVLSIMAECAGRHGNVMSILPRVLILLYEADVLEEGAIVAWYEQLQRGGGVSDLGGGAGGVAKGKEVVEKVRPVVEWLQTAEEESSEEEEEGD